ncbi:hypothetical protein AZE42_05217 [Rhizopogon vesiculosus]|uniref:Uncharacterized protein n=1 Tax=Rhizopogon vesiculosus TaxID=180088 RepID=A0A1J8QQR6_9AGAM|nr:hypothetical protein AZE42_05217 [Rhizopogon vesiculosus]
MRINGCMVLSASAWATLESQRYKAAEGGKLNSTGLCLVLGNWLMEDVNPYLDGDGTLHAKLKIALK